MEIDTHSAELNIQAATEQPFTSERASLPLGEEKSEKFVAKQKKQQSLLEREAGKSLLPLARVQKIMKADKVREGIFVLRIFI